MDNFTLLRRKSYLGHLKQGLKIVTWSEMENATMQSYVLYPDSVLRKAGNKIG